MKPNVPASLVVIKAIILKPTHKSVCDDIKESISWNLPCNLNSRCRSVNIRIYKRRTKIKFCKYTPTVDD